MFLVQDGDTILLDIATAQKDLLLKRLAMYKLRAKVTITATGRTVAYSATGGLPDPRHPQLPHRLYDTAGDVTSDVTPTAQQARALSLGIPELGRDFAPDEVVVLDAGYDLLNAVSFTKGCYVGQEIAARMHYKNIARKGFYILTQNGTPQKLALLKFDDVEKATGTITLDGITYKAVLPEWMTPKLTQFKTNNETPA